MDYKVNKMTTSELVIAEAKKLGLAAPADVVRYIAAVAEAELEVEVEALWEIGKRPEGSYWERFTKHVVIALKEHADVLTQMGR